MRIKFMYFFKKMASAFLVVSFFSCSLASADPLLFGLPILNLNAPGAEMVTLFPDHRNENQYYRAPTVMTVAKDENGAPLFSYMEYEYAGETRAVLQATMRPHFNQEEFNKAKESVGRSNPNAKFTALPFKNASVAFTGILSPFVIASECTHSAGLVGDEQSCSFRINQRGTSVFKVMLKRGVTVTMRFQYAIEGVIQGVDGRYQSHVGAYAVAGRIGSKELAQFPQLFIDSKGRIINVKD